jgi:hypothetical protein
MRIAARFLVIASLTVGLAAQAQNAPQTQPAPQANPAGTGSANPGAIPQPKSPSAGGDIGHGAGDIGKGTGKGAGKAAEGVGKGAGDLVTVHPVGAAKNVGKGAGEGAKDIGVGAAKGTGKIGKGTGKLIAKPFHHGKKDKTPDPATGTPQ